MNLREELEAVRSKHHGRLTPRIVLKEATNPKHPLHSRFEWDDGKAAHMYRLEQAHELLASVRISYKDAEGQHRTARAYSAVRAADEEQYDYLPTEDVLRDPVLRKILLRDMERQIAELVARYEHMNEFWQLLRKQRPPKKAA